jgi:hypothetical protein
LDIGKSRVMRVAERTVQPSRFQVLGRCLCQSTSSLKGARKVVEETRSQGRVAEVFFVCLRLKAAEDLEGLLREGAAE